MRESRSVRTMFGPAVASVVMVAACGGSTSSAPPSVAQTSSAPPALSPSASATGWVTVTPAGGGFSLEMPGTPVSSVQTTQTDLGPIDLHIDLLEDANGAYITAWGDYPPGSVAGADPAGALMGGQDSAVENVNGTLIEASAIDVEGVPGREFSASIPGGTYHARIFLDGDRLVQMAVIVATGAAGYDPERFFDSLRFS